MDAKLGLSYGVLGSSFKLTTPPETATFATTIAGEVVTYCVRFVYDNFVYDDYVLRVSQITRDGELSAGVASIVLSNIDQTFNVFVENRIDNMGKECRIGFYFPGVEGILYLFTGDIEDVSYDEETITLSIRDALSPLLEKRVGSGQDPVDYYTGAYAGGVNPAELVFDILRDHGHLDGTAGTANQNIDYNSWTTWANKCGPGYQEYLVQGRFTGQTIRNILLRIGIMTHTYMWPDEENKIHFSMYEPPYVASESDPTFDEDNIIQASIKITTSTIKNIIRVAYGHDPDAEIGEAVLSANSISFNNNHASAHTIAIAMGNLLDYGFNSTDLYLTVTGSTDNDGTYYVDTITAGLITLRQQSLADEGEGATVTITQANSEGYISSDEISFDNDGWDPQLIKTSDTFGFLIRDFVPSSTGGLITVSGSNSNDGNYWISAVATEEMTISQLTDESVGAVITLTQRHAITGRQFEWYRQANETSPFDSITNFGGKILVDEDKTVWFSDANGAGNSAQQRLTILKYPEEVAVLRLTMEGFLLAIGGEVHHFHTHRNIVDMTYWVRKFLSLDLESGTVEIEAVRAH